MHEGWCALCISILKTVPPEMAFLMLDGKKFNSNQRKNYITDADMEDMIKLKAECSYRELGKIYGLSGDSIYRKMKSYKERMEKNE